MSTITRFYTGKCTSLDGPFKNQQAPAVALIISREESTQLECRFIFFTPEEVVFKLKLLPVSGESLRFAGVSHDPRGWDVNWTATLQDSQLVGTYEQPSDKGIFVLKEME